MRSRLTSSVAVEEPHFSRYRQKKKAKWKFDTVSNTFILPFLSGTLRPPKKREVGRNDLIKIRFAPLTFKPPQTHGIFQPQAIPPMLAVDIAEEGALGAGLGLLRFCKNR
jgi:hypothetical protein